MRSPLFLIGLFVFAIWPARAAVNAGGDPAHVVRVAGWILAVTVALEVAGRIRALSWQPDPWEEFRDKPAIAVLEIGLVLPNEIRA